MDMTLVAAALMVFAIAMYVLLDGFDLGVGILFPFARNGAERGLMMDSIAPLWDGNETWLVMGGGLLFAAFPRAYAILFQAWYLPFMVFLFALMFRGVAFEFRARSRRPARWSVAFGAGSIVAAFAQGTVLGSFILGIPVRDGQYAGGAFDWLSPFSLVAGLGLVAGYALLGATWLVRKTEGDLQALAFRAAKVAMRLVLAFIVVVSVYTPWAQPAIAARWFGGYHLLYLAPVPLATAACAYALWRALARGDERTPFFLSVGLFMLSLVGLGVSLWPYAVPRALTLWDASAPPSTQRFMIIGVLVLLPVVLGYSLHTYRVFRHKVTPGGNY